MCVRARIRGKKEGGERGRERERGDGGERERERERGEGGDGGERDSAVRKSDRSRTVNTIRL